MLLVPAGLGVVSALLGPVWEEALGAALPAGPRHTVAGLATDTAGRLPRVGERVDVPGFAYRATAATRRRVGRVEVTGATPSAGRNPA